jgi:hypothetical protein
MHQEGERSVLTEMQKLSERSKGAWLEKDAATLKCLIAEDYLYVGPNGLTLDRTAIRAIIGSPSYRLDHGTRTEADGPGEVNSDETVCGSFHHVINRFNAFWFSPSGSSKFFLIRSIDSEAMIQFIAAPCGRVKCKKQSEQCNETRLLRASSAIRND